MTASHRIEIQTPFAPQRHGRVPHAPPPLRQRDRGLLLIAVFKFVKAALFVVVALGSFGMLSQRVADRAQDWVATLAATYDRGGLTHRLVVALERIAALSHHRLEALGVAALFYAAFFVTEGIGLWRCRRWAEWLTVIATASLVPLEGYELARRLTLPRVAALLINLVVVAYLVWNLRRHAER
jgi:uncharacterized membrane protein (DUF2068 family)